MSGYGFLITTGVFNSSNNRFDFNNSQTWFPGIYRSFGVGGGGGGGHSDPFYNWSGEGGSAGQTMSGALHVIRTSPFAWVGRGGDPGPPSTFDRAPSGSSTLTSGSLSASGGLGGRGAFSVPNPGLNPSPQIGTTIEGGVYGSGGAGGTSGNPGLTGGFGVAVLYLVG